MFGFATAVCTTSKYFPALVALLASAAIAVGVIVFMVHEGKRHTNKAVKAACIAGGVILAPIIWLVVAQFMMPSGCLF